MNVLNSVIDFFGKNKTDHSKLLQQAEILRKTSDQIMAFVEKDKKYGEILKKINLSPDKEEYGVLYLTPGVALYCEPAKYYDNVFFGCETKDQYYQRISKEVALRLEIERGSDPLNYDKPFEREGQIKPLVNYRYDFKWRSFIIID